MWCYTKGKHSKQFAMNFRLAIPEWNGRTVMKIRHTRAVLHNVTAPLSVFGTYRAVIISSQFTFRQKEPWPEGQLGPNSFCTEDDDSMFIRNLGITCKPTRCQIGESYSPGNHRNVLVTFCWMCLRHEQYSNNENWTANVRKSNNEAVSVDRVAAEMQ